MSLNHKSQSALEYMMTYGWAILVIVIVAAVLYSLGIFSPSSSLSTTITGFSNLGTVNAVCLGGTSFTISMGDSTGYPINVTEINLTSSSGKTTYSPNILIQPNSIQTVTVPSSSLCTSGARYSVSAVVSYLEPGQIFPGPYTSTGTVAGTANSPPSSATFYEPLNIANTQSQGTSSPFQQMINVTSTSPGWGDISSSPFGQNVEFFSSTGQILDSWLENYTSTHAIWWVKLTSSIPAGSKQTIYMGFASTSTNLFNTVNDGEAPQLSSTYAEYDDGANVFTNYWNFAGTSLPSGWSSSGGGSITVNNGVSLSYNGQGPFVEGPTEISSGMVLDALVSAPSNGEINIGGFSNGYVADYGFTGPPAIWAIGPTYNGVVQGWVAASNTPAAAANTRYVITFYYNSGAMILLANYQIATSTSDTFSSPQYISFNGYGVSGAGEGFIQWIRTRAYPPNGVMPSVSFGSVS